jgi:hypothetical protein
MRVQLTATLEYNLDTDSEFFEKDYGTADIDEALSIDLANAEEIFLMAISGDPFIYDTLTYDIKVVNEQ